MGSWLNWVLLIKMVMVGIYKNLKWLLLHDLVIGLLIFVHTQWYVEFCMNCQFVSSFFPLFVQTAARKWNFSITELIYVRIFCMISFRLETLGGLLCWFMLFFSCLAHNLIRLWHNGYDIKFSEKFIPMFKWLSGEFCTKVKKMKTSVIDYNGLRGLLKARL